jgi:hypothetical protein
LKFKVQLAEAVLTVSAVTVEPVVKTELILTALPVHLKQNGVTEAVCGFKYEESRSYVNLTK